MGRVPLARRTFTMRPGIPDRQKEPSAHTFACEASCQESTRMGDPQRLAGRSRLGDGGMSSASFGRRLVVAGQFGSGTWAGHRVALFGGGGEHVRVVGAGAAGQGDVGMLAILG